MLELSAIGKKYGTNQALNDVSFRINSGQIVALVGENGAGKSTLIKILAGIIPVHQYQGNIAIAGSPAMFYQPRDSQAAGLEVIHQELVLCPSLTVAENICLGDERSKAFLINQDWVKREARIALERLGVSINLDLPVADLSVSMQQIVEIAQALRRNFKFLILDEPTSSLSEEESLTLFKIIQDLRKAGQGILYVSHRMSEVFKYADEIVVLRDGQKSGSFARGFFDHDQVISCMVGRPLGDLFPRKNLSNKIKPSGLQVKNLSWISRNSKSAPISLGVASGEIVGLAGLLGAGKTSLLSCLFGLRQKIEGQVILDDRKLDLSNPGRALKAGICLVSEDRKRTGVFTELNLIDNACILDLAGHSQLELLNSSGLKDSALRVIKAMGIVYDSLSQPLKLLSGGNQQKMALGRSLSLKPRLYLLDEPTRGIDVGAKREVYKHIRNWADQGSCVLMASSELTELLGLCDRILVLSDRALVATFNAADCSEEKLLAAMLNISRRTFELESRELAVQSEWGK